MNKEYHFPNVGFVQQAFLYSIRFLLMHPVYSTQGTLLLQSRHKQIMHLNKVLYTSFIYTDFLFWLSAFTVMPELLFRLF